MQLLTESQHEKDTHELMSIELYKAACQLTLWTKSNSKRRRRKKKINIRRKGKINKKEGGGGTHEGRERKANKKGGRRYAVLTSPKHH